MDCDYNYEEFELKEWKKIKILDYFEIVKPNKIFQIQNSNEGKFPLISSTSLNNGISKFIDDYSFDGEYLTIARNGNVGFAFVQYGKFGTTSDIIVLRKKENINIHLCAIMITYCLTKKYNYSNKLSLEKLIEEEILIPFN